MEVIGVGESHLSKGDGCVDWFLHYAKEIGFEE